MTSIDPGRICINCCATLDDKENRQLPFFGGRGFYTLNCASRVEVSVNSPSVYEVPLGRALSTVLNLKSSSSSQVTDDNLEGSLFQMLESSAALPICLVCYLVLSDLYRTFTEFKQLRSKNSFLGAKLLQLENKSAANASQHHSVAPGLTVNLPAGPDSNLREGNELEHNLTSTHSWPENPVQNVPRQPLEVKMELFVEEAQGQEEFNQVTGEFRFSAATVTSILPDGSDPKIRPQFQSTSKSKPKLTKRSHNRKTCSSGPKNSSSSFTASNNLVEGNPSTSQLQFSETESRAQFQMEGIHSEANNTVPGFSTGAVGAESTNDEFNPAVSLDPVDPSVQRHCDKINKEGNVCGGLLKFYNRKRTRKSDNTVHFMPTLRCSKRGCQKEWLTHQIVLNKSINPGFTIHKLNQQRQGQDSG